MGSRRGDQKIARMNRRRVAMKRWAFLIALLGACGCGPNDATKKATDAASPVPAVAATPPGSVREPAAQQTKIPRVVMVFFGPREHSTIGSEATALLRGRLTELGYVEGRSIVVEERYADGDPRQLTALAREVVDSKPEVIVTGAFAATAAVRQATSTIPIVMLHAGNPVGSGLVESLSHPGGNVTGTTSMVPDLGAKQVELLRQLIPGLARLGVLLNPANAGHSSALVNVIDAARLHGIRIVVGEITRVDDFETAFGVLRHAHPDALLVMMEPLMGANRRLILEFAATNRLPASYDVGSETVRQGGLISYGPVVRSHYALGADYVDKILKGAQPGSLPVQQPTQFALTINLKTARSLGLTIPQSLLLRADEVIR
jgi:putative ABC transport system substrate-binding protein